MLRVKRDGQRSFLVRADPKRDVVEKKCVECKTSDVKPFVKEEIGGIRQKNVDYITMYNRE